MRRIAVVIVLAFGACVPPPSRVRQDLPLAPPREAKLDLAISSFLLANGLRVVLVKDPKATDVQVTMRYQVGSVDDPAEQPGMAHLVEHLMFEPTLDGESLFSRLEATTTYFNGVTTFDATTYVARGRPEELEALLAIEVARVETRCKTISASAFVRERAVVVNELRQRDRATEALRSIYQALYPVNHPYRRAVGGSVDSVAKITREQACAFADAHYAPNNAALVVSGNFTDAQQQLVLHQYVARSPRREVAAPAPVHRLQFQPWYVSASVPFDDAALLVAWPLPREARMRAKVRTLVTATAELIGQEVSGGAVTVELGDTREPLVGIVIVPAPGETLEQLKRGMERGVMRLPGMLDRTDPRAFGDFAFTRLQQTAVYRLHAMLEDGERDSRLASLVLGGGDPRTVFGDELAGLHQLTGYEAGQLARTLFTLQRAKVVELRPSDAKRAGPVALARPLHDKGRSRRPVNPADAGRPATPQPVDKLSSMTWRKLANGMQVVLMPSTSVPTVEMRLVFRAGTGDELADKRGAAQLAAHGLAWDERFGRELVAFAAVGGAKLVEVDADHTTFIAHGMDMYLHSLLTGLQTWVVHGVYDASFAKTLQALHHERLRHDGEAAFSDAWRGALFGRHPYVHGGIARHASSGLTAVDASAFRQAYYTPDNATLVIAGRFDPAIADRWIDHLFGSWRGQARPRSWVRVAAQPSAIAEVHDRSQVQLRIAFPATAGDRVRKLVAAEMLAVVVEDVRHKLGASYDLTAALLERRLVTMYVLAGWIDASRITTAVQLVRDEIAKLRRDDEAASRAFVVARARVATRLRTIGGGAAAMALRVERDIALYRRPFEDLTTVQAVRNLTLDQMRDALADLDLARAVTAMRGPAAGLQRGYDALGRKPRMIR